MAKYVSFLDLNRTDCCLLNSASAATGGSTGHFPQ